MLANLHVKNLALIEEADINFKDGLNILTGETGAGKSIILGSVNLALGGKAVSDMIRSGADYALTELSFDIESEAVKEKAYGIRCRGIRGRTAHYFQKNYAHPFPDKGQRSDLYARTGA